MKSQCDKILQVLVDLGPDWIDNNPAFKDHLATCSKCQALSASFSGLETVITYMPQKDVFELFSRRLERMEQAQSPGSLSSPIFFENAKTVVWKLLKAVSMQKPSRWVIPLLVFGMLILFLSLFIGPHLLYDVKKARVLEQKTKQELKQTQNAMKALEYSTEKGKRKAYDIPAPPPPPQSAPELRQNYEKKESALDVSEEIAPKEETGSFEDELEMETVEKEIESDFEPKKAQAPMPDSKPLPPPAPVPIFKKARRERAVPIIEKQLAAQAVPAPEPKYDMESNLYKKPAASGKIKSPFSFSNKAGPDDLVDQDALADKTSGVEIGHDNDSYDPKAVLDHFLADISDTTSVKTQEASGYWSNTYVPGDPVFRRLGVRLKEWDRSGLISLLGTEQSLDKSVRPVSQPFDNPDRSALALFLQADKTGIQEKSRVLVQVGIKATARGNGNRTAMNIGLVLDLSDPVTSDVEANIRAVLHAFLSAKEIGDRFHLIIAGRPVDMHVTPADFRFGYISVLFNEVFKPENDNDPVLGLVDAIHLASRKVAQSDDPNAPLGSSSIILITSRPLTKLTMPIAELAHADAVNGMPLSVIGIGDQVILAELDRIILAGQGNRRLIHNPDQANELVERELTAVSRVVARALRLRIRLLGDTQLVEVIHSRRLDEKQKKQVKEAEKSIDLRIAANLGIKADRDEDEDGIQIIIPSFYAGDSHVILLDVVAQKPGAVADVTLRYKDLIMMRNGISRANLSISNQITAMGPLPHNVLKNRLTLKLADVLKTMGDRYAQGNLNEPMQETLKMMSLLRGFRDYYPGFSRDPDLKKDLLLLNQYLTLFKQKKNLQNPQNRYIADSLRFSGYLKLMPRPDLY